VTICEGLRKDLIARGVPRQKITVVPNGVDVDRFAGSGAPDTALKASLGLEGSVVLGFVGSFYAYEGLDLLVAALPQILSSYSNARMLLVGGGFQEGHLRQQAISLGLADKIVFTGRVPHDQVNRYYDLIDVLVYPRLPIRLTELVTPLKPLEAMAQGRLVVASDVGGHRELMRDGETATLFKAGNVDDLANKVTGLLSHSQRWPSLRSEARRYVERERSWKACVLRYHEVYGSSLRFESKSA
jgi:PEP-CTERM/exosortase A-associated glycosyltransferase